MKLGMFYWNCGHHIAAWRHPDGHADGAYNLSHLIELARIAERGLFDMFFMADSVTFWRGDRDAMTRDSYSAWIEPFTLMCALSQHTKHLGLVCTATSTYEQPYFLARRFASLDIASGGRAGWNLVTAGSKYTADSFGYESHVEKATRYRMAREFAHVVRGLWNSWGDGSLVLDKESGVYLDFDHMHVLEHEGEFFKVKGPLNVPASPQGEPVLVQAGASEDGRQLAAETAEVIFGASQTLERAQAFYADIKGRAAAAGRDPNGVKIMPGLSVSVAPTQEEAQAKLDELHALIDPKTGVELVSQRLDYDLSGCSPDDYLPEIPITELGGSRAELIVEMARRENMTIRDLYHHFGASRGHKLVVGTPGEVVDIMEEWVSEKGCDGFNIMPPNFPSHLEDFVELVVPELQRRGLFRTEYEGSTLRENLGLTRPAWSPDDYKWPERPRLAAGG